MKEKEIQWGEGGRGKVGTGCWGDQGREEEKKGRKEAGEREPTEQKRKGKRRGENRETTWDMERLERAKTEKDGGKERIWNDVGKGRGMGQEERRWKRRTRGRKTREEAEWVFSSTHLLFLRLCWRKGLYFDLALRFSLELTRWLLTRKALLPSAGGGRTFSLRMQHVSLQIIQYKCDSHWPIGRHARAAPERLPERRARTESRHCAPRHFLQPKQ